MEYLKNNPNVVRMDLVCALFISRIFKPHLRMTEQLRQFVAGLAYLHNRAIVHGDLKPVWHTFSTYFAEPELM